MPYYEFYDERAFAVLMTAVARGLGFIAIGLMLAYLGTRGARAQRGVPQLLDLPRAGRRARSARSRRCCSRSARRRRSPSFLDGARTVDRADDIGDSSVLVAAQLIGIPGTQAIGLASLALGLAWVVICLNGMRVGLLTRFMGVLGVICGALIVLPILSPLPIVQTFWLGAMALLLAGRWPNGLPPAWTTGEAVPWPSSAAGARGAPQAGGAAPPRRRAGAGARSRSARGRRAGPPARRLEEEEA